MYAGRKSTQNIKRNPPWGDITASYTQQNPAESACPDRRILPRGNRNSGTRHIDHRALIHHKISIPPTPENTCFIERDEIDSQCSSTRVTRA